MRSYLLKKLKKLSFSFLSILCFPLACVLKMCGYRIFGCKNVHNLGHLALEPDTYLKQTALKQAKQYKMIFLAPTRKLTSSYPEYLVCNLSLLNYWKKYFIVIESPLMTLLFSKLKCWKIIRYSIDEYAMDYLNPSPIFNIYQKYKGAPFIQLTQDHLDLGRKTLSEMGLPSDAWFICFHVRESFYSSEPEKCGFSCRNSDMNMLYEALKIIEQAGGWCIRMGDKKTKPLSSKFNNLSHLIDYTKTLYVSDWMDLYLSKSCTFFLGGSSGLSSVPSVLGTPCVLVNCVPFCNFPFSSNDLAIPKLYFSRKLNRLLRFSEITSSASANYIHNYEFGKDEIELIENTEEEIASVVKEMLAKIQGIKTETPSQKKLREQFALLFHPHNFCYGFSSQIGSAFLEKYHDLF